MEYTILFGIISNDYHVYKNNQCLLIIIVNEILNNSTSIIHFREPWQNRMNIYINATILLRDLWKLTVSDQSLWTALTAGVKINIAKYRNRQSRVFTN